MSVSNSPNKTRKKRFKIISFIDGKLHLNTSNLAYIFNHLKNPEHKNLPVSLVSVIGGFCENERLFYTYLLLRQLEQEEKNLEWILTIRKEDIEGFQRQLFDLGKNKTCELEPSGIFLWPLPYLGCTTDTEGLSNCKLVWVLYPHISKASKDPDRDSKQLYNFLALVCSRIIEINRWNVRNVWQDVIFSSFTFPRPERGYNVIHKDVCENFAVIYPDCSTTPYKNIVKKSKVVSFVKINYFRKPLFNVKNQGVLIHAALDHYYSTLAKILEKMCEFPEKVVSVESSDKSRKLEVQYLQSSMVISLFTSCVDIVANVYNRIRRRQPEQEIKEVLDKATENMVNSSIATYCNEWFEENIFISHCTKTEIMRSIKKTYQKNCNNLVISYENEVEARNWDLFCSKLEENVICYFQDLYTFLREYHTKLHNLFGEYGYFPNETLEQIFVQEEDKAMNYFRNPDKLTRDMMSEALRLSKRYFRKFNNFIGKNETTIFEENVAINIDFYNKQMEEYLQASIYQTKDLENISNFLIHQILLNFKKLFHFHSGKLLKCKDDFGRHQNIVERLELALIQEYKDHALKNKRRLKGLMGWFVKAFETEKLLYIQSIEAVLEENLNGVEEKLLEEEHFKIKSNALANLTSKILQVREDEPANEHCISLAENIDLYWEHVKEKNQSRIGRCQEKPSAQPENEQVLAFYIDHESISLGIFLEEKVVIIPNEYGEESTPFVVGIEGDHTESFSYGTDALVKSDSITFAKYNLLELLEFFKKQSMRSSPGGNSIGAPVTPQMLVGYLLQKLKSAAAQKSGCNFPKAVFTGPGWLIENSDFRQLIRQGAVNHSGFRNVDFLNGTVALASKLLASPNIQIQFPTGNVLVLSEASKMLEVTLLYIEKDIKVIASENLPIRLDILARSTVTVDIGNLCKRVLGRNESNKEKQSRISVTGVVFHTSTEIKNLIAAATTNECESMKWYKFQPHQPPTVSALRETIRLANVMGLREKFEKLKETEEIEDYDSDEYYSAEEDEGNEITFNGNSYSSNCNGEMQPNKENDNNHASLLEINPKYKHLSKAKQELLSKCDRILGEIEAGVIAFATDRKKRMAFEMIAKARSVGENEGSSCNTVVKMISLLEDFGK